MVGYKNPFKNNGARNTFYVLGSGAPVCALRHGRIFNLGYIRIDVLLALCFHRRFDASRSCVSSLLSSSASASNPAQPLSRYFLFDAASKAETTHPFGVNLFDNEPQQTFLSLLTSSCCTSWCPDFYTIFEVGCWPWGAFSQAVDCYEITNGLLTAFERDARLSKKIFLFLIAVHLRI